MAANRLDLTLRINAEDHTGPGRTGLLSIEQQLTRLRQTAGAFLTLKVGEIISGQIGELIKTADAYKTLESRLKIVSDNTSEYAKAQTELFAIAQRTRGDLAATYNVYGKLESAIKLLGGTQTQALATTETLNQAIALTSQGASQDAAAILQFSQALGSGVLRGDEFNSVMENAPGLAQALADGLDVPITKLRGMAEAGQLTADKLINALGKSADDVAAKFAKIPLTVGGATTQLNNAFTQFVGLADKSSGASATLANGISTLAKNLNTVADAGLIAAEVYGAKLVLGLSRSTQSLIEGTMAARARAAADQMAQQAALELLRTETQLSGVRIMTARSLWEEARLQVVLAGTERERAMATAQFNRASTAYHAAENTARANQIALTAALTNTRVATTLSERAFTGLNSAMQLAFSFQIGMQVGEWLNQFEKVRQAGSYVAETFVMLQSGAEAMLNRMSFADRWAQIKQIHEEFNQVRAGQTEAAMQSAAQINAAEETKTKTLEAAALKQQASFKMVQDAVKALTLSIDAESKQQTTLIEQSLTDRMAAIDAMDISETQKDTLRVNAKLAAYQQLALLQQQASTDKLALIDREYAAELTAAAANAQRTAEIETQKRQAKLAVYTGLADYYQGEIAKLSQVYATEFQAAQQARQQLEQLNQSHEQALFNIKLMGMDEREKLEAKQSEYDKKILAIKAEQAKGERADQVLINKLMDEAKALNVDITQTAGTSSEAIYKAKARENEIWTLQKGILEINAKAHEDNANRAKAAQDAVAENLQHIQGVVSQITAELNKDYQLKVGVDQGSLSAIQSTIAELTKPETKVITIVTQNVQAAPAPSQATGGPAGLPTGQVWKYANGGYTPKTGKLPGFGGGDKVKALLEAGEWIIRKEAVAKLGEPFMQQVNAGRLPIKRAGGGLVSEDEILKKLAEKKAADDAELVGTMLNNYSYYEWIAKGGTFGGGRAGTSRVTSAMTETLWSWGRRDLAPYVVEGMKSMAGFDTLVGPGGSSFSMSDRAGGAEQQDKLDKLGDRFNVTKSLIYDKIKAGATKAVEAIKAPVLESALPSVNLQQFVNQAASATNLAASSTLLQAAKKTVNIQFAMPGGEPVAGQFNESDMDKLFKTLKDAGLRSTGGHF